MGTVSDNVSDQNLLSHQMRVYEDMRPTMELDHLGEWVVFHGGEIAGFYESFEKAAEDAVQRFGRGPYLIKRVGAYPAALSTAALYGSSHAIG